MSPKLPKPNLAEMSAAQGDAIDSRYHPSAAVRRQLNKVFPTHWSFLLGEIALYSFIILLITGVYLTLFFDPSMAEVTYDGVYQPLRGVEMSRAYASALDISFEVRGGLFVRQIHHWAALMFAAAIMVHLARVFSPAPSAGPGEWETQMTEQGRRVTLICGGRWAPSFGEPARQSVAKWLARNRVAVLETDTVVEVR